MKIVLVTGGFDPLHSGHIQYFKESKKLGNTLIVGLNSDEWLIRKKGQNFMSFHERSIVVSSIDVVDGVYKFDDSDGSAIEFIKSIKEQYPNDEIIFSNGGDRTEQNIPEMSVEGVKFVFGVGGNNKINSSSKILEEWKSSKTNKHWGYYRVLYETPGIKVKEFLVEPGKSLSMQRHFKRSEMWCIAEGKCVVDFGDGEQDRYLHQFQHIAKEQWHRLYNPYDAPCRIVEIQYGEDCNEEDIERK